MPAFIFKNTGSYSWTPSDNGVTDGTNVRFHAVGSGYLGADGAPGFSGGDGGGGGARCSSEVTIADATSPLNIYVGTASDTVNTSVADQSPADLVVAFCGDATTGGNGGTGTLFTRVGGAPGIGAVDGGGGGGAAASDGANGNNGSAGGVTLGGAGGAGGATQFGVASAGAGGTGGNVLGNGQPGTDYGSGGGGGSSTGSGAVGKQGLIIACWGAMLTSYPTSPFTHGFVGDPDASGVLLMGSGDTGLQRSF